MLGMCLMLWAVQVMGIQLSCNLLWQLQVTYVECMVIINATVLESTSYSLLWCTLSTSACCIMIQAEWVTCGILCRTLVVSGVGQSVYCIWMLSADDTDQHKLHIALRLAMPWWLPALSPNIPCVGEACICQSQQSRAVLLLHGGKEWFGCIAESAQQ